MDQFSNKKISRRSFLKYLSLNLSIAVNWLAIKAYASMALGTASGIFGYSKIEPYLRTTRHYDFETDQIPESIKPLKVVIASDFHVGCPSVTLERLKDIVKEINACNPDIILMPGDFLNGNPDSNGESESAEDIAAVLSVLKAKYGTFATLGNHDYSYKEKIECNPVKIALKKVGIRVLENESEVIDIDGCPFQIIGVGDKDTRHSDVTKAFNNAQKNVPTIAMCHNPLTQKDILKHPLNVIFTAAGHTHGSQAHIPFYGSVGRHSSIPERYVHGCVSEKDAYGQTKNLIVTSGLGTSRISARFNCPPEKAIVTLSPKVAKLVM